MKNNESDKVFPWGNAPDNDPKSDETDNWRLIFGMPRKVVIPLGLAVVAGIIVVSQVATNNSPSPASLPRAATSSSEETIEPEYIYSYEPDDPSTYAPEEEYTYAPEEEYTYAPEELLEDDVPAGWDGNPAELIGVNVLTDPDWSSFTARHTCIVGSGLGYTCDGGNVEVDVDTNSTVVSVLMVRGYDGPLPEGISWENTPADLEATLGPPDSPAGDLEFYWRLDGGKRLTAVYTNRAFQEYYSEPMPYQIEKVIVDYWRDPVDIW